MPCSEEPSAGILLTAEQKCVATLPSLSMAAMEILTAEEAKEEIELYLEKLYEFDPKTVGGALPQDDFYYLIK